MGAHELQTASDYELRYRYLRMQGKATVSDFAHLDSMFISHRNPQAIHQLEQKRYQLRTSPTTTIRVTDGTETYFAGAG